MSLKINSGDLGKLMPMHLAVDPEGRVYSCGKILAKILGNVSKIDEMFLFQDESCVKYFLSQIFSGNPSAERFLLRINGDPALPLRGQSIKISQNISIINLGFGVHLSSAVQEYNLTSTDFSPSDLAMEFLFLHEANLAVLSELARANTYLEAARNQAQILSITDPLTGLLKRRGFDSEFSAAFERRKIHPFALLHLDLDSFKEVNDLLGHSAGDRILIEVSTILTEEVRAGDKVFRVGGDEFLLLIFTPEPHSEIQKISKRIITKIEAIKLPSILGKVSASIGIAIPDDLQGNCREKLLEFSDKALYKAKSYGQGKFIIWKEAVVL